MTSGVTPIASRRKLALPPDRGRLLTPDEVAEMLGQRRTWVMRNLPNKVKLGPYTARWFEADVRAWLSS